jgi:rhodanese-related sulfurtransferase
MRSSKASQKLLNYGFHNISQLKGGLSSWKAAGLKTNKSQNAPISLFRQVQIVAGFLVAIGTGLGAFVSPWFLLLSGFVGCGLVFAGVTNTCAMGQLLAKLPYNR